MQVQLSCPSSRLSQSEWDVTDDNAIPDLHRSTRSTLKPVGRGLLILRPWISTRLLVARKEGCCDMHTPKSVRSMCLTSSGYPRPGSGGPTEPLRHQRLRMAGSGPHAPRRTASRRTSMGLQAVSGPRELRADARPRGATGCTTLWAEGAMSGPRAELDIGADKRTST
jgi:hypothetical protein